MNRNQLNSPFNRMKSPDGNFQSPRRDNDSLRDSLSPDFIPFGYSSPLSSMKKDNNQGRVKYKRGIMRLYNKSLSFSSPQSSSSYGSLNNSFNSNQGNNRQMGKNPRWAKQTHDNKNEYESSLYFHPAMLQDPWAEFENNYRTENVKMENINEKDVKSEYEDKTSSLTSTVSVSCTETETSSDSTSSFVT